jgi:hypothetical protein
LDFPEFSEKPCTSGIAFRLCSSLKDKKFEEKANEAFAIAMIGATGDYLFFPSLKFSNIEEEKRKILAPQNQMNPFLINIYFFIIRTIYKGAEAYEKAFNDVKKILLKENLGALFLRLSFLENKYKKYLKKDKEISKKIIRSIKKSESLGNFVFIPTEEETRGVLASLSPLFFPNKNILACSKERRKYILSFRSSTINLYDLFDLLKKEIPSFRGGGHIVASGAKIDSKEDLEKIKRILKKYK